MAKFCAWCGKPVDDGDVFCGACGRRADGSDAPAAPSAPRTPTPPPAAPAPPPTQPQWQPPAGQPAQQWDQTSPQWQSRQNAWVPPSQQQPPQPPYGGPQHAAPSGGGKKGALIGGIIAAVVVAAVLVGGFVWPGFFKKDGGGNVAKPGTEQTEAPTPTKAPAKPDAPGETEAPRETDAPKPIPTPEATPEPTQEPTAQPFTNTFTDVSEGDWYYDAVMWAGEQGLVSGTEFKPNDPTTRGQALTFLWRAAGEPASVLKVSPYSDVSESDWYYAPVLWGFEKGLISAAADGQFHADGTLTRAQAVTFLCRAVEGEAGGSARSFCDVREGDWYFAPANWAVENGIVGRSDNYAFKPDDTVTRANLLTMLYRAYDPAAKKAATQPPDKSSFADLGIDGDVDDHGLKYYHTLTKNGKLVSCNVQVSDYRVFDAADGFPAKDGYEWRVLTFEVNTPEGDGSGWNHTVLSSNYYNIVLDKDSCVKDANGSETRTVVWDGRLQDYTLTWRQENTGDNSRFHVVWTAQVPKGFDGLVVGIRNKAVQANGGYLHEYYTSGEDFALFRMK